MRVTVLQYATAWQAPEENLAYIREVCISLKGHTDMLLLHEMFNTGYTMVPQELPPKCDVHSIEHLTETAAMSGILIGGSMPTFREGRFYNTFQFISGQGVLHSYDKIHLFGMAGEHRVYTAGQEAGIFDFMGFHILPLICYDLRFSYLTYTRPFPDLIVYTANWPIARVAHWKSLLVARAIENQSYVIGINRTGTDSNGYEYPGASCIISPNGEYINQLKEQPDMVTVTLNLEELKLFRQKLPFLQDRNDEFIDS
jgi:predicted amidohydrolase